MLLILGVIPSVSLAQSFTATPSSLTFSTGLSTTTTLDEELVHTGTDSVFVYASIIGTDSAYFSVSSSPVLVGIIDTFKVATAYLPVMFGPAPAGTYHAKLVLTDHTTWDTIPLTATVTDYIYALVVDTNAFYNAYVGNSECLELYYYNPNPVRPIVLTALSFYKGTSSKFSADSGLTFPDTLSGLGRNYVRVCYTPTAEGTDVDSLILSYYLDGTLHTTTVELHGTALINYGACVAIEGDSSRIYSAAGVTRTRDFKLVNNRSVPIVVTNVTLSGDLSRFSVSTPATPFTLAAGGGDAAVVVTHRAGTASGYNENLLHVLFSVADSTDSCSNMLNLAAQWYGPTVGGDTGSVDLYPNSTQKIDVALPRYDYYLHLIKVTNNSSARAKIDTAYMLSGAYLSAMLYAPADSVYPFLLPVSSSFWVGIQLFDSTQTSYDDTLVIVSENGILPTKYPVHVTLHASGVAPNAHVITATMAVFPNPSHGSVTVDVASMRNVEIEVLDMLGRTVATGHPQGSTWMWSGTTPSGAAPNGTYILRATGVDSMGARATLSSRITLTH